jgi:hypothetical protein
MDYPSVRTFKLKKDEMPNLISAGQKGRIQYNYPAKPIIFREYWFIHQQRFRSALSTPTLETSATPPFPLYTSGD